jgi:hypothetical protein
MGFPTSLPNQSKKFTVTAADAIGTLTFSSNAEIFPGSFGWLSKDDNSECVRVMVIKRIGSTQVRVRRAPDGTEAKIAGVSYGGLDTSAWNADSSLTIEVGTYPINMVTGGVREIG